MKSGTKGLDKFYAGFIGGMGAMMGWYFIQSLFEWGFNLKEDFVGLLFGLFFLLGGTYWIIITFSRTLMIDSDRLIRKTLLYTNYVVDLNQIRGLGNLSYTKKGFAKFPYQVNSIEVLLDTGNTLTLKLNGLSPSTTIPILEQIGKKINPSFEFTF